MRSFTIPSWSPTWRSNHARSRSWLLAFVTVRKRSPRSRYVNRSSSTPPRSLHSSEYWAPRPAIRDTSLESSRCSSASAPCPDVSTSPMWLTSTLPARSRTAMCSSRMPAYCTGISQPANGTSFAPAATWRSCSGVRLSVCVPAAMRRAGPYHRAATRNSGASGPCSWPSNRGQAVDAGGVVLRLVLGERARPAGSQLLRRPRVLVRTEALVRAQHDHDPAVLAQVRDRLGAAADDIQIRDGAVVEYAQAPDRPLRRDVDVPVVATRRGADEEQRLTSDPRTQAIVDAVVDTSHGRRR